MRRMIQPNFPSGAELSPGPSEQVALPRLSGAELSFTGRRLTRHWQVLPSGETLSVALYARGKGGYVVAFDTWREGAIAPHAAGVDSLEDALCFLEDYCTRLPEAGAVGEGVVQPVLVQSVIAMHRTAAYRAAFLSLVGEALSAWVDLPKRPGRKQDKATA